MAKRLDELARQVEALTVRQKLIAAVELLDREKPDMAEAIAQLAVNDLIALRVLGASPVPLV